jgi:uncharacterized protein (TIGR00730 family)
MLPETPLSALQAALLEHPSYREADRDIEFLGEEESRGLRLQLEYLKAERLLAARVRSAVLVLGSARKPLTDRHYESAREFGRIAGKAALGHDGCVMTGGGPGLMEAANRGAREAGAPSVGLNIILPQQQLPNPYITPELCLRFRYFALRKLHFMMRARAVVAFPGGFGTLDELFETLTLVQTGKIRRLPIVLIDEAYWRGVFNPDFLVAQGAVAPGDLSLFFYAETATQAWQRIVLWYAQAGEPVFPS